MTTGTRVCKFLAASGLTIFMMMSPATAQTTTDQTLELAGAIDRFNPDKSWTPVVEQ